MDKKDKLRLNLLSKELQKTLRVKKFRDVASYGPIIKNNKDGKFFCYQYPNEACHAGLGDLSGVVKDINDTTLLSVANGLKFGLKEDECSLFLEWLLNYSPYNNIWIHKSPKSAISKGYLLADPDSETNLLVGGFMASRAIWEHEAYIGKIWNAFVRRGCNPNVAFLMGHIYRTSGGVAYYKPIDWHVAISGQAAECTAYQTNFVTNKPRKTIPYRETYEKRVRYRDIYGTWGYEDGHRPIDFKKVISNMNMERTEKNANPFKTERDGDNRQVPLEALTEYLTPILNEKIKV